MKKTVDIALLESCDIAERGDICMFSYGLNITMVPDISHPVFHIYVTSDDPIRNGDYCINGGGLGLLVRYDSTIVGEEEKRTYRKVIATTDREVRKVNRVPDVPYSFKGDVMRHNLKTHDFYFVAEMVFTDDWNEELKTAYPNNGDLFVPRPVVQDGELSIHIVQEEFTRQEVIDILEKVHKNLDVKMDFTEWSKKFI